MVNSTNSVLSASANNSLLTSSSATDPSGTGSADFADTLATCMLFGQSGSSQTASPSGSSAPTGQAATQASLSPAPVPAVSTPAATLMNPVPATTATTTPASTSQPAVSATDLSSMTPDQAYWASQPPAVQALQNMPDDQRYAAAQQLANEGYTIDVPIMVWGWDPLATMVMRQDDGLTWVPSAMQADIPVAPGDSFDCVCMGGFTTGMAA